MDIEAIYIIIMIIMWGTFSRYCLARQVFEVGQNFFGKCVP